MLRPANHAARRNALHAEPVSSVGRVLAHRHRTTWAIPQMRHVSQLTTVSTPEVLWGLEFETAVLCVIDQGHNPQAALQCGTVTALG